MKKIMRFILIVVILIFILGIIWNWFLDCKTKCKILMPGGTWACKENCVEVHEINNFPWWLRLYISFMRRSKDCYPQECCCHQLFY